MLNELIVSDSEEEQEQEEKPKEGEQTEGWKKENSFKKPVFKVQNTGPTVLEEMLPLDSFMNTWKSVEFFIYHETNKYAKQKKAAKIIKSFLSWVLAKKPWI